LEQEEEHRQAEDDELKTQLDQEADDRKEAEQGLEQKIQQEAKDRKAGDLALIWKSDSIVITAKSVTNLSVDLVPREQVMNNLMALVLSHATQGERSL